VHELTTFYNTAQDVHRYVKIKLGVNFDLKSFSVAVDVFRYTSVACLLINLIVYALLPETRKVPGLNTICYVISLALRLILARPMVGMFVKKDFDEGSFSISYPYIRPHPVTKKDSFKDALCVVRGNQLVHSTCFYFVL